MTQVTPLPKKGRRKKSPTPLRECDELFSLIVRNVSQCQSRRENHAGRHQCAHGFSRRYKATRWDLRNAWCFCAGCHYWFTTRPLEWDVWMRGELGPDLYGELRALALSSRVPDMKQLRSELRETWKELAA